MEEIKETVEWIEPLALPEYEDDNLGHKYMTLWSLDSRENASFEKLTPCGSLLKGRVDFYWNFKRKDIKPYRFYLLARGDNGRQAALFNHLWKQDYDPLSLLNYINMGKPIKINQDGDHYFTEFDASTKQDSHRDDVWTDTGIVEIGMFYVDNDWETVKVSSSGDTSFHITIDEDDFRDIEVCVATKAKDSAVYRFRRDIPLLRPVDFRQTCMIGNNRLHMKLQNDTDFVVDLTSDTDKITEFFWRHVN